MMASGDEVTAIHAVPAQSLACGFRLLVLRELQTENEPPAFAFIAQRLLRLPQRLTRHGLFFGRALVPDVTAWLTGEVGRPSLRDGAARPVRNPRWPVSTWHREPRRWPGDVRTIEWSVDVVFADEASWAAFRRRWQARLAGGLEEAA
jgi:hypothetical protein